MRMEKTPERAGAHCHVLLRANGSKMDPFKGRGCSSPTATSPASCSPHALSFQGLAGCHTPSQYALHFMRLCMGGVSGWSRANTNLESRDPKFLSWFSLLPAVACLGTNLSSLNPGFSTEKMMPTTIGYLSD